MLKIKDNADLKKLKEILNKYNLQFKYSCDEDTGESYISSIQTKEETIYVTRFVFQKEPIIVQEIAIYFELNKGGVLEAIPENCIEQLELIYDLTKEDLVERVEE